MSGANAAAQRVIMELGIKDPKDLRIIEHVAWARGAQVREAKMTGAEARIVIHGQQGIITVSSDSHDPCRKRFSIAHELGHFELHRDRSSVSVCLGEDIESWNGMGATGTGSLEIEANEFASCILMPEQWFAHDCRSARPSLSIVAGLADKYMTSLTATARRYVEFCDDAVAVVFSRGGFIRWFQGSPEFMDCRFFIDPRTRLSKQTFAGGYFNGAALPTAPRSVFAENWLDKAHPRATIIEHSRAMPSYDAVLSLLWIKDDIMDDDDDLMDEE